MLPNQLSWFQISIQKTKILKQENSQQSQSPGWITFDGGVGTIRFSFCWAAHFCACSAKKIQAYLSSFGGSGLSVPPVYYITIQPCWFSAKHNWRASPNAWNVVQLLVQTWILFFCLFIVFNSYSFMLYTVDLTIPLTLCSEWQVYWQLAQHGKSEARFQLPCYYINLSSFHFCIFLEFIAKAPVDFFFQRGFFYNPHERFVLKPVFH